MEGESSPFASRDDRRLAGASTSPSVDGPGKLGGRHGSSRRIIGENEPETPMASSANEGAESHEGEAASRRL